MKIAFIGQKGVPAKSGGVEAHVDDLATKLVQNGHEVFVYTRPNYTDKNLTEYNGIRLISLPNIPSKCLDAISHTFLAIIDAAFKRDFDVIHFHSIGPSSLVWLSKLINPKTPVVSTFHSQCYFHQKWGSLARTYLRLGEIVLNKYSDRVVTVSKTLRSYVKCKYNVVARYIPNGVKLIDKVDASKIKDKWGLEKDSYILLVSRLVRHKGISYLIDAFNQIETNKKLVIVGSGAHTDAYVNELLDKADDNPNIIMTGEQTGKIKDELFSNAYLFVQPSETEGLAITLLEAMAAGTAVLVSDIPENMEAVHDKAFAFKNKNVSDLADVLQDLIDNPEKVRESANAGKDHVIKNYNWKDIANELVKVYRSTISDKVEQNEKIAEAHNNIN